MKFTIITNYNTYISIGLLLMTPFLFVACYSDSGTASEGLSAKDLSVEMHVSNNRNNIINIEVMLRSGPVATGESVYISGDDRLIISTIGGDYEKVSNANNFDTLDQITSQVKILRQGTGRNSTFFNPNSTWYFNQFDIENINKEFTLIMERPSRKTAKESVVKLPEQFELDSPLSGDTFSRQGDIILAWNNSQLNASMSIIGSLICVSGETQVWKSGELFPDQGWYTIPANSFINYPGVCSLTLRATRTNLGELDPAFTLGGIILGHQIRSIVVNTVP